MNIGALPRRCRPFSRTESGPLKSQEQYKTQRRSASALFPIAHEKPVFVVGSWSLGPRHVLEINERNCGSENKKDLGEDTSRGEITKGQRSGRIVVVVRLVNQPEYNGRLARVVSHEPTRGVWNVFIEGEPKKVRPTTPKQRKANTPGVVQNTTKPRCTGLGMDASV